MVTTRKINPRTSSRQTKHYRPEHRVHPQHGHATVSTVSHHHHKTDHHQNGHPRNDGTPDSLTIFDRLGPINGNSQQTKKFKPEELEEGEVDDEVGVREEKDEVVEDGKNLNVSDRLGVYVKPISGNNQQGEMKAEELGNVQIREDNEISGETEENDLLHLLGGKRARKKAKFN